MGLVNIGSANISRIQLRETVESSTPPAVHGYIRIKSDGLHFMGDDGIDVGPLLSTDDIPDNFADFADALITAPAEGDLLYRDDLDRWVNFAHGSTNQILMSIFGITDWEDYDFSAFDIFVTAGELIGNKDVVYVDAVSSLVYKVDIDFSPLGISFIRGIVASEGSIPLSGTAKLRIIGIVDGFTGLTPGAPAFASTVAGGYTQTKPNPTLDGNQLAVLPIGIAISATEVFVWPSSVEFCKNATLSVSEVSSVTHCFDVGVRHVDGLALLQVVTNPDLYSLRTSLISWWAFEQTSSNPRLDSHGTETLTPTQTPGKPYGKIGYADQLNAVTEGYLYRNDSAGLSTGDIDFSIGLWVYCSGISASTTQIIIHKAGEYSLWLNAVYPSISSSRYRFSIAGGAVTVVANAFGFPGVGWHHVLAWHNAATNTIGIRINNAFEDTIATGGVAPADTANPFYVGTDGSSVGYFNVDEAAFWKKILSSAEITALYNGGVGIGYASTAPIYASIHEPLRLGRSAAGTRDLGVCFYGPTETRFVNTMAAPADVLAKVRMS